MALQYGQRLTAREYLRLRSAVGWTALPEEQAAQGLQNSDFLIACRHDGLPVGCARILWDKGYIAYLADVMVDPEFQGQGIGRRLVAACLHDIESRLKAGWRVKIVITASKGKEGFYEKLGFQARPNERDGAGIQLWKEGPTAS